MKSLKSLAGMLLIGGAAAAQAPPEAAAPPTPAKPVVTAPVLATPTPAETLQSGSLQRPTLGAFDTRSPIGSELYIRTGPSFIIGGGALRQGVNSTGWQIEAGGRSLFFNTAGDSAFVLELGLSFTGNTGGNGDILNVTAKNGTAAERARISGLRRTGVSLAVGRDWFPNGGLVLNSNTSSFWRYGWDAGLRWGTGSTDFDPVPRVFFGTDPNTGQRVAQPQLVRLQDVYGQVFIGLNANLEVPMGGTWSYLFGMRLEGSSMWSSLVPGSSGSLYEVGFLIQAGLRF